MYTIFPRCPRARRPQKDKTSIAFIESGVNLYVAATANPKIRPQLLINNTHPSPRLRFHHASVPRIIRVCIYFTFATRQTFTRSNLYPPRERKNEFFLRELRSF